MMLEINKNNSYMIFDGITQTIFYSLCGFLSIFFRDIATLTINLIFF